MNHANLTERRGTMKASVRWAVDAWQLHGCERLGENIPGALLVRSDRPTMYVSRHARHRPSKRMQERRVEAEPVEVAYDLDRRLDQLFVPMSSVTGTAAPALSSAGAMAQALNGRGAIDYSTWMQSSEGRRLSQAPSQAPKRTSPVRPPCAARVRQAPRVRSSHASRRGHRRQVPRATASSGGDPPGGGSSEGDGEGGSDPPELIHRPRSRSETAA